MANMQKVTVSGIVLQFDSYNDPHAKANARHLIRSINSVLASYFPNSDPAILFTDEEKVEVEDYEDQEEDDGD